MTSSIISVKGHEGKCSAIAFDDSSNNVLTVDYNGNGCAWSSLSDNCVKRFSFTDSVNSMVYEKDRVFISTSNNIVESFSTHNSENVAVLAQFLSEVNHMRLSKDKSCFVACSSDNTAKVIQLSLDNNESREIVLLGHHGPVMSVDIDADCTLVATASCDGTVIIWRARDGAKITELSILDEVKDISLTNNRCRLRFSPSSDPILAVPLANTISLLDCDDWNVRGSLTWQKFSNQQITECLFSDDGCYLVAGTSGGKILVWDIESCSLIDSWSSSRGSAISGMLWYPKKMKTLLLCDVSGYWEAVKIDIKRKEKESDVLSMDQLDSMFEDFDEDDVMLDGDGRQSSASTVPRQSEEEQEAEDDSGDEFNLSMIKAEYERKEGDTMPARTVSPIAVPVMQVAKKTPHPPVRPGTTAVVDGLQLLLWNEVGAIKRHYDDDDDNSSPSFLEVYFHDCDQHRSIIIRTDTFDCDMADLNTMALLLVSDPVNDEEDEDEDKEKQAVIRVQSINGLWDTWSASLPAKETPVACCLAGEEYAVVLTSSGMLRYFSLKICGMQSYVESVHGTPVALASSGHECRMHPRMVVVTEVGDQLVWRLEELRPGRMVCRGQMAGSVCSDWHTLPLTQDARLTWIGFSDAGVVYTVDSKQNVRRLQMTLDHTTDRFTQPRWSPVLDLRFALDKQCRNLDRYFPIGFTDNGDKCGALVLRCHGTRYPRLVPWPHLTVVPFKVPLCAGPDEVVALESALMMHHMIPDWTQDTDRLVVEDSTMLLKLFLNALTQNSDFRAMSLAKLMPDSATVQIAIRAAGRVHKNRLVEKLGQLALRLDEEAEAEESQVCEVEENNHESEDKENNNDEDEVEGEDDMSVAEEPSTEGESVMRSITSVLTGDRLLGSAVKEMVTEKVKESPFRVSKPTAVIARGMHVVDKMGLNVKKDSPKKNTMAFGNFVPSLSAKTFQIKRKRKSAVIDGSPIGKKSKK